MRLDTELLERIDAMAKDEGRTRSNMIDRLLLRGLENRLRPEPEPVQKIEEVPVRHQHVRASKVAGLDRCACGAVRGTDGEWRQP
jgi:metal-responsive CopG/Arc/MetJ family transcriptional regulator